MQEMEAHNEDGVVVAGVAVVCTCCYCYCCYVLVGWCLVRVGRSALVGSLGLCPGGLVGSRLVGRVCSLHEFIILACSTHPNNNYHPFCHGDDFVVVGCRQHLQWVESESGMSQRLVHDLLA